MKTMYKGLTCLICDKPVHALGYCNPHYKRFKRLGDPLAIPVRSLYYSSELRFWGKVEKTETCWIWTKARNEHGYGVCRWEGKRQKVHRLVYESVYGAVPDGYEIDHLCRNTSCVRLDHLEVVTHTENMRRKALAKTHCKWGHPFDEENTLFSRGRRNCRTCIREQNKKHSERQSAKRKGVA